MRDPDEPAFHDYLVVERAYYDASSRHLDGLVTRLADEAASRIPDGDEYSVSWPRGGFTYRTRVPEHGDNWQLLRSREGESSEEVLLDENVLAEQTGYVEVGVREPSPDGALLAWSADTTGAEYLRAADQGPADGRGPAGGDSRQLHRGGLVASPRTTSSTSCRDELHRPFQVWRHRVGTPASDDTLVFEEPDQRFELTLDGSRSGELAIITSAVAGYDRGPGDRAGPAAG